MLTDAPIVDEEDKGRRRTIWDTAENFIYIIWSIRYGLGRKSEHPKAHDAYANVFKASHPISISRLWIVSTSSPFWFPSCLQRIASLHVSLLLLVCGSMIDWWNVCDLTNPFVKANAWPPWLTTTRISTLNSKTTPTISRCFTISFPNSRIPTWSSFVCWLVVSGREVK